MKEARTSDMIGSTDREHQRALGDRLMALVKEKNELIFPCPGGSPSGAFLAR